MKYRKVYKVDENGRREWVAFEDLRKGDDFEMYEPTGVKVTNAIGQSLFTAESDPELVGGMFRITLIAKVL